MANFTQAITRLFVDAYGSIRWADNQLFAVATDTVNLTCDATKRGTLRVRLGGVGVADTIEICKKDAADVYGWTAL